MQNMEQWLKVKTAGLPRWAWVLLLGGALGAGIYIRTRHQEEEYGPEEEPVEEPESGLSQYEGTEQAGGLAAAGLVGPAQGQITPVESPVIPEGFVDVVGAQQETLSNAIGALANREPAEPGERVETTVEIEGEGQVEREKLRKEEREEREKRHHRLTGGGSPNRKPHHKPPKKPKQHKPKPKQHKPKRNRPRRRRGVSNAVKA